MLVYKKKYYFLFSSALLAILFWSCSPKTYSLYQQKLNTDTVAHIHNFYATSIFKDYITSEIWITEDVNCLQVINQFDAAMIGEGGLHLTWNKTSGGCKWIGMGIGWDNWTPKNLQSIYQNSAIQFMAKSPSGIQSGLPWAIALEDYSGGQAWAGVFANFIEGQQITEQWTKVQIPLTAFDFNQFDADITSIKGLIIQFESEGSIYLDELQIVPYLTSIPKQLNLKPAISAAIVDGVFDEFVFTSEPVELINGQIWLSFNNYSVSIFAKIEDKSPLQNNQSNDKIWNGDALEIAFSTNVNAQQNRKSLLISDQHFGIKASETPQVWNWRTQQQVTEAQSIAKQSSNGYILEAVIPISSTTTSPFIPGKTYGLELAIDAGDINSGRVVQYRWNSPHQAGFNNTPQVWGKMTIDYE